jgi:hypothetical protein
LLFLLHHENGGFSILMKDIYISQEIPFFHDAIFFILVMEVLCR